MNFPIMTPTRAGLPNSCSVCGLPVTENHWMAENTDTARSGSGLCVACYVSEKAVNGLAQAIEAARLEPNPLEQVLAIIPDEDILVSATAAPGQEIVTSELVTGAAAEEQIADTKAVWVPGNLGIKPALAPDYPVTVEQALGIVPPKEGDDLARIKGIGPTRVKELNQLGILSFRALSAADLDYLETAMEASRKQIESWQKQAQEFSD